MLKFLILSCLIIKIHSWTWNDYPSPIGITYWRCGILSPTYVCDPDGMLNDQQRKEIIELVEDFKGKTKRPNSIYTCLREGVRLVVALAKYKIGPEDGSDGTTYLCGNNRNWTASYDATKCEPVHGIELNTDGFRYCDSTRYLLHLHKDEFEQLDNAWVSFGYRNCSNNFSLEGVINRELVLKLVYISIDQGGNYLREGNYSSIHVFLSNRKERLFAGGGHKKTLNKKL
ncbi:unnamed protein product [Meloidogyne enterolobii]|uniref:Uncharacterized protein n=1 Tax=Meloidogyne enterolobii TaxID=390850 RepID=A0ACB1A146_MELEN